MPACISIWVVRVFKWKHTFAISFGFLWWILHDAWGCLTGDLGSPPLINGADDPLWEVKIAQKKFNPLISKNPGCLGWPRLYENCGFGHLGRFIAGAGGGCGGRQCWNGTEREARYNCFEHLSVLSTWKCNRMTSLVVQWLGIHLPRQRTWAPSWSGKVPRAAGQLNPSTTTTEPGLWNPCSSTREATAVRNLCTITRE